MPHLEQPSAAGAEPDRPAPPRRLSDEFEGEIDFSRYLRPLYQRWPMLVALALVGAVAGLAVSSRRPILYDASTSVLVQQVASATGLSTARALLRNNTLAAETLAELGLDAPPYQLTPQRFIEDVLEIQELAGTYLLRVRVRLADPVLGAEASHLLARKAVALNRRVTADGTDAVRGELKVLLDQALANLQSAEQALLVERNRSQIDVLRRDTEVLLDGRAAYQHLLIDLEAERSRLEAAERELAGQTPLLAGDRMIGAEDALRRAAAERSGGETVPSSPRTSSVLPESARAQGGSGAAQQGSSGRETNRETNVERRPALPANAKTLPATDWAGGGVDPDLLDLTDPRINPVYQTLAFQVATSRIRLANLERRRQQLAAVHGVGRGAPKTFSDLYRGELELARLEDDYQLARRTYSDVAERYDRSRTESVGGMMHLQIVDPAVPPEQPISRKRAESVVAGLIGGLILAAVLALAMSRPAAPGQEEGSRGSSAPTRL